MTKILFNKEGLPLMAYGEKFFATTTGSPAPPIKNNPVIETLDDTVTVSKFSVSSWGEDNNFPNTVLDIISKTGVLNSGLKYIRNFTLGQGVYPVRVTGFDEKGNETLEVVNDPKITSFLNSRVVRRYMANTLRDYLKLGSSFPELIPNHDGSKIVGINTINARHVRLAEAKHGRIDKAIISGDWPNSPSKGFSNLPVLDLYDPTGELMDLRIQNKIAGKSFIYPVRDEWANDDYYPKPAWYSAYLAGWITIANEVPIFLKKAYANQISWLWHVKIPYAYWDKRYPKDQYRNEEERKTLIQSDMDKIEDNLTGSANANKAIFSMYSSNAQGKPEEQWVIESLDNKYKEGDKLVTSAAANSEILFSLMINPNVLGAGMPGGTYAGNQGGSNIREAFLVNIANAWLDRQNILDPIEAILEFNGVKDVQLRFRNTILTTLDSGAGTTKNLS
ncbi:MAG: hypothetical protein HN352_16905 [Bacteroidetes bacterium]|jgi:hypothetical protein|nr:hypothetical protein [Bacteroidota bacterium]MBT3748390.1 hypothetical protein [Bacteroidota bacterium]MBT4410410.1 hypothetical protein [Bacteroidota bacterium]MBT7464015.1 hypothetical protein [Bacteroidota bacterium]